MSERPRQPQPPPTRWAFQEADSHLAPVEDKYLLTIFNLGLKIPIKSSLFIS